MRISGNGNLAALVLAFAIGLTGPGLVHQSAANPPSARRRADHRCPAADAYPARQRPCPLP